MPSILADIYWAESLLPEILTILFTQSIAVLHKYLNDKLKILCLLQFFPEVAQNSLNFPCSEKSLSIPGFPDFPGLWPLCWTNSGKNSQLIKILVVARQVLSLRCSSTITSSSSSSSSSSNDEIIITRHIANLEGYG